MSIHRLANIKLPKQQSAFLWGARKTGKSTFLHEKFPDSIWYDLLKTDELRRLIAAPHLLREELLVAPKETLQSPIVIDEPRQVH